MFRKHYRESIRYKFLKDISIILFASTCVLSTVIAINEGKMLKRSLMTKGQSILSTIAKLSEDALIMKDSIQLDAIVNEARKDEDIIYIIFQDAQEKLLTSQYASINYQSPRLKVMLSGLSKESELPDIIAAIKKKEAITELSLPILTGTDTIGYVTICMSQHNIRKQIVKTILFVIALNLVVTFVLGSMLFIASKKTILDPIIELGHAATRLAKGDLSTQVKIKTTGEIQMLVNSFNQMAEDLEKTTVSKEYVDNIIKSMNDTLLVVSPEGDIMHSNASACALLGYEEKELIGQPVGMVLYEELSDKDSVIYDISANGSIENIEKTYLSKDGRKIPMLFSASAMREENDDRIQGIVCVAQDITDRKRAEEALLNAAQQWRTTFDGISDIVCLLDREGRILRCNKAMAELLKRPFSEIIGRSHCEIVHGTTAPIKECPVELMRETRCRETATLLIDERWFNVAVDPLLDEAGGLIGAVHIMSDVTDHKRAEEALRESEDRYRDLVEYSQYLILTHNLEGQILSVNQGGAKNLGYEQRDLLNKKIPDLLPIEVRNEFDTYLDTIQKDGVAKGLMLVHTASGEKRIWEYNNTLRTEGVTAPIVRSIAHDVTDRLRTEKAVKGLAQENAIIAEIGRIINSSLNIDEVYEYFAEEVRKLILFDRIVISVINTEKDTVSNVYMAGKGIVDREVGKILSLEGSGNAEMVRTNSTFLIQTEDPNQFKDRFPALFSTFQAGFRSIMNVPLFSKGQIIGGLLLRSLKPYAYADKDVKLAERVGNQIAGAIANAQLFIERKRAEEEKESLSEQLRQSQKMEAIGKLAGGVAHDFNNLLTVIHGYSELLLNSLEQGSRLRQDVQEIKNASERASSLTRQLLAFSRKQVLQPEVLDLNALVSNMDKMLRRMIGEDIELVTLLTKDLGRIKADPGQIEQVILNLAVNAKDAMRNGGKLTIETANVKLDENYARSRIGVTPGNYLMLSMSDTGVGMTPETKERIFEPFFTTKEKGRGTGLGLSTVYGIVQQSGGNIWVYSEPGLGTTFKIYLPRIEEGTESLRPAAVPTKSLQGSETVLLVEDEEMVRKLAYTVLQRNGYNVLEASSGDEALDVVQGRNANPIHLVVTDVVMPGMSGRQLADRVVSLRPEIKILYMSGYTDDAIVHHGVLDPGIAYIQKPFTSEALASKVREILDGN